MICWKEILWSQSNGISLRWEMPFSFGRSTAELQKRAIEKINRAGGIACRVESVEDAKRVIERVDLERSDTNA